MRNSTIDVMPVTGGVGCEIGNVDLASFDERTYEEIRRAWCEHGVIFFRDQNLTLDQYIAFGKRFGTLVNAPSRTSLEGHPEIGDLTKEPEQTHNIGNGWHTDQSYQSDPIRATILYAQEIPPFGGDTLFVSMAKAYDALSDGMKKTLEGLKGVHSYGRLQAKLAARNSDNKVRNAAHGMPDVTHPVVIAHPETGRKSLYINETYTSHFEGWTEAESRPLLDFLVRHSIRPEFQCRFRWREGSLAMWDDFQTWHYAVNDYQGQRRQMFRLMVEGSELKGA